MVAVVQYSTSFADAELAQVLMDFKIGGLRRSIFAVELGTCQVRQDLPVLELELRCGLCIDLVASASLFGARFIGTATAGWAWQKRYPKPIFTHRDRW